ncbi:MAG: hypothetical protein ACQEP5_05565 [Actinomycetota bacterium]
MENLEHEVRELEEDNLIKDNHISEYEVLISNFNLLLSTVYYGSAVSTIGGKEQSFTAFSMNYGDNYYIITAGHCIEYNGIKYEDFKFKANRSGLWIYPKLLGYESDPENNRDYAVFYHPSVRLGLLVESEDKPPKYVIGNSHNSINILKQFDSSIKGESGSPILSSGCRLVGMVIKDNTDFTPISVITEAIEGLEND